MSRSSCRFRSGSDRGARRIRLWNTCARNASSRKCNGSWRARPGPCRRFSPIRLLPLVPYAAASVPGAAASVDLRKFFDTVDHRHMRELPGRRVPPGPEPVEGQDGVITRLIGKWLKAGVWEKGEVSHPEEGTPPIRLRSGPSAHSAPLRAFGKAESFASALRRSRPPTDPRYSPPPPRPFGQRLRPLAISLRSVHHC